MVSEIKEFLLLRVIFPVADWVMGTRMLFWYKKIENMNSLSQSEITKWQNQKLSELINFVYEHTIYYREIMDQLGLKPEDFKSTDDLNRLPVLSKEIIKKRFDDIVPDNIHTIKHRKSSTGGSTGDPLHFLLDENTWGYVTAAKIFAWRKTGFRYGNMYISLGSSSLFPVNKKSLVHEIYYKIRNTIPLNGMNMEDAICEKYLNIAREHKVKYLYGYASAIYLLASYAKKNNITYSFNAVFTTSEILTEDYRQTIETAFNTKVMDCYGARDGGVTAFEIERGKYFVGYNTFCEVADSSEISTLYCTNLIDYAFPMIRYELGDEVLLNDSDTQFNGQVITKIGGRSADIIRLVNGRTLTNPGFTILFKKFNINAYQVMQIDELKLKVKLQKTSEFHDKEELEIISAMKKHAGDDCEILIEYTDNFPVRENGKRNFFMSK
jgi:phenylacetate-CoA ligase